MDCDVRSLYYCRTYVAYPLEVWKRPLANPTDLHKESHNKPWSSALCSVLASASTVFCTSNFLLQAMICADQRRR